jgi:predicted Zn finger-like uncharacterized protein
MASVSANISFTCPHCAKVLRSSKRPAEGKKVKCPACGEAFVPELDDEDEATGIQEKASLKGNSPAKVQSGDDKPRGKKSRRGDDEDAAPEKRRRGHDDDEDEEEEDSARKKKKTKGKVGSNMVLIVLLVLGGGAFLLVCGGVGVTTFVWPGFLRGKPGDKRDEFAAGDDVAITIKLKDSGEGDSILLTKTNNLTSRFKATDAKGKVLVDKNDATTEIKAYKETVLKREGRKPPTKLERAYTKLQVKTDKGSEVSPLQGKTVVIERKGETYTFVYKDGQEVAGPPAEVLAKEFARKRDSDFMEKLMLPKDAVKVGASWEIAAAALLKEFNSDGDLDLDLAKATGSGKLLKAYQKTGRQFGEMNFRIEAPLKSMGKGAKKLKFVDGARITLEITLDTCIDGSSEAGTSKHRMTFGGNVVLPNAPPGASATLSIGADGEETQEEPAKQ